MPNDLDITAASLVCSLVEFRWGTASVARYAAFSADVEYKGDTYTALPGLAIEYAKQDGSTDDQPAAITMALASPVNQMMGTFPPVKVTITELRPGTDLTAAKTWAGKISRVSFNQAGNAKTAKLTVAGAKAGLQTSLSLSISGWCQNVFGGGAKGIGACGMDLEIVAEDGTITAIDGSKITVTGLVTINTAPYWQAGGVRYDGFEVKIYSHHLGTGQFYLTKPPPAYWLGQVARFYPGCLKDPAACAFWGQTQWFNGIGLMIPNREVRAEP